MSKIILRPQHGIEITLDKPIPTDPDERKEFIESKIGEAILRLYLDGIYKDYFEIEIVESQSMDKED